MSVKDQQQSLSATIPNRRQRSSCHALQRKPWENYALKELKSIFSASNSHTLRLWRIASAICKGPLLQLLPVCAKISLNRPVMRWISVYLYNLEVRSVRPAHYCSDGQ